MAYKLALEPVIHFQVKSDTSAHDLLYHFDTVRYFHDANLRQMSHSAAGTLDKAAYVERRALWKAFTSAMEQNLPRVLLIDEIDKAPRDFPNDLLHELDKMEFTIIETGENVEAPRALTPIVFITSNSERRLPEAFLRRCVYHHIRFDDRLAEKVLLSRRGEYANLSDDFLKMALDRFLSLRDRRCASGHRLVSCWSGAGVVTGNWRLPGAAGTRARTTPVFGSIDQGSAGLGGVGRGTSGLNPEGAFCTGSECTPR